MDSPARLVPSCICRQPRPIGTLTAGRFFGLPLHAKGIAMPINQRVLVVDDDAVFAEAIGSVLRQAGFKVDIATHFVPALKILEDADAIDLLIIDLVMPSGINGIALSRMASMRRPGLRSIYVTGHDIPGVEREAVGPGTAETIGQ